MPSNRLAGVALDVFSQEPIGDDAVLRQLLADPTRDRHTTPGSLNTRGAGPGRHRCCGAGRLFLAGQCSFCGVKMRESINERRGDTCSTIEWPYMGVNQPRGAGSQTRSPRLMASWGGSSCTAVCPGRTSACSCPHRLNRWRRCLARPTRGCSPPPCAWINSGTGTA